MLRPGNNIPAGDRNISTTDVSGATVEINTTVTDGIIAAGRFDNPDFIFIVVVRDGGVKGVLYAKNSDSKIYGSYPARNDGGYVNFQETCGNFITDNYDS
ncbi:MAG: hypothetical protein QM689_03475 [Oscillospiraceae bacterium]